MPFQSTFFAGNINLSNVILVYLDHDFLKIIFISSYVSKMKYNVYC